MSRQNTQPLTEATYLILVSLLESRHGYGIIQNVEHMSQGKIVLGPGTLYGALSKLEKQGLIQKDPENSGKRRKNYILTDDGRDVVKAEFQRLKELISMTEAMVEGSIQNG